MRASRTASGVAIAVSSSLAFGTSGTLIKPLLESGWSPAAAVTLRVLIAGTVLAVPAVVALRGRFAPLWRARGRIAVFAVFAVAGTQLGYFAAVQRIPVSTALLIEYLAPVGLVIFVWARSRRRPAPVVLAGSVVAMAGLVLVIGPSGGAIDPLGVLYAALAAVGLAFYFVLAARTDDGLPPIAMTAASLLLGGAILGVLALLRVLPFQTAAASVHLGGASVHWWVPLVAVALISTAYAYVSGIAGAARLGSRLASFLGLLEVVFAGVFAWLLLGEDLGAMQLGGAALILVGVLLVRAERAPASAPVLSKTEEILVGVETVPTSVQAIPGVGEKP